MKKIFGMTVLLGLLAAPLAQAKTVLYQPTPYPPNITCVDPIPPNIPNMPCGVHIWDGWITNVYYGKTFIRDDTLKIGGWGDTYRTYIRFDVEGLPQAVSKATLWLNSYQWDDYRPTGVNFNLVTSDWTPSTMDWAAPPPPGQPSAKPLVNPVAPAPAPSQWWPKDITESYNAWKKSDPKLVYGLRLDPQGNNHQLDAFRSSRYNVNKFLRPILQIEFTPPLGIPNFKLPLPAGFRWLLTNEVGGYECKAELPTPDVAHQGPNYFSIDISWQTNPASSYTKDNTPVLAAAGGKVFMAGGNDHHSLPADYSPNGFYIVIDHSGNKTPDKTKGFTTRYLHLKAFPSKIRGGRHWKNGDIVHQGEQIGIVGSTGWYIDPITHTFKRSSTAEHLHFGIRYKDNGASSVPELTELIMEGLLIKSYQTECVENADHTTSRIKYYPSTNTPTEK